MSEKNELQQGMSEEIKNEDKDKTKLDKMIEEFNKKNPGKGCKKIYGTYQS
jgi:hypothetical protein